MIKTDTTGRIYRTFTRRAKNWDQFSSSRKHAIDRNLTLEEARQACKNFNDHRTPAQERNGTKMEFERQS
jgi:hypothetical protein